MSDNQNLKQTVEALLFSSPKPLSVKQMQSALDESIERQAITQTLDELRKDYQERAVDLVEVASGYRFQVGSGFTRAVQSLHEERPQRYSRAVLETLALVAYRQPITRAEIEDIRGVSVSTRVMGTLLERNWVRIVGYADSIGRPAHYGTTKEFLDYFNLKHLDDLPPLGEVRELSEMNAEMQDKRFNDTLTEAIALEQERKLEEESRAQAEPDTGETAEIVVDSEAEDEYDDPPSD